jgi:hypothetical protein
MNMQVPGGALNLNSTNYPEHGHCGDPPLSGKNPHGRTRDLMISSQKRWPLDHDAGRFKSNVESQKYRAGVLLH